MNSRSVWWHIKNTKSGKCLNVQGASKKNSVKVIQYTCQSVSKHNDQWQLLNSGWVGDNGDLYTLHNRNSNLCLNAQGASTANGTDLIQYTCSAQWNDLFTWWPAR
jgi:Ricin-type beta-trefoil lectin domain-like